VNKDPKIENFEREDIEVHLHFGDKTISLTQVWEEYEKKTKKEKEEIGSIVEQFAKIMDEEGKEPDSVTYIYDEFVAEIDNKSADNPVSVKKEKHIEATIPYEDIKEKVEEVIEKKDTTEKTTIDKETGEELDVIKF
jgi:hypothetical protein